MRKKYYFNLLVTICLLVVLGACSSDDIDTIDAGGSKNTKAASGTVLAQTNSYASSSVSFTISKTTTVAMTVSVARGLNQWYEINKYPNSVYGIMGKTSSIIKRIYITPQNSWGSSSPEYTEEFTLEPGTYWVSAEFPDATSQLGPQNGASLKHGVTHVTVKDKYGSTPITKKVIETHSDISSSISFTVDKTVYATLTVSVGRGLNQWYEIIRYPNSVYGILGKSSSTVKRLEILPQTSWGSNSPEFTETITLEPGTYWLAASFPKGSDQLGPQDGASYKHGRTYVKLEYNN